MDRFILPCIKKDMYLDAHRVVCVYGPTGCGKTTWVKDNLHYIEIDDYILRSKEASLDFIERVKCLKRNILIDNFDPSLPGAALFIDAPVSKGSTILVSRTYIPGTLPHEMSGPDYRQMSIGVDAMDAFEDYPDIIRRHLTTRGTTIKHIDLLRAIQSEHGNVMGIVHENVNILDPLIFQSFSDADIIDTKMYSDGDWNLLPFFIHSGCVIPCIIIDGSVRTKLRPATLWTKHMNVCMNMKLFRGTRLHIDVIDFLAKTTKFKFYKMFGKRK
jgi:hypothetical protein